MGAIVQGYGQGNTDYEKYIRTEEIFRHQKEPSERVNGDELLFQVTHQTAELWMKTAIADLRRAGDHLDADEVEPAIHLFSRAAAICDHLARQVLLIETISPRNYHQIREGLGQGSGNESPGFNELLDLADELRPKVHGFLERTGTELIEIYRAPEDHPDLYRWVEAVLDWDEAFQRFRYDHFCIVRRIIGTEVESLKGVPAGQLAETTTKPLFPELWEVMNRLTNEWGTEYGTHG